MSSRTPSRSRNSQPQRLDGNICVLIVDDHPLLRQSVQCIVDGCLGLKVVGQASNGLEAIDAVRLLRPDVVVMDINMPKMDGIAATKHIKEEFPDTSVIGLSPAYGMDMVPRMEAAGIFAYLKKESIATTLCQVIQAAAAC